MHRTSAERCSYVGLLCAGEALRQARGKHLARARALDDLFDELACREQLLQVDAGLDSHRHAEPREIFGGDVARRAFRVRAAADAARAAIKTIDAEVERGEHVRDREAARVVQMQTQ